jgi:hypothetical protein
MAAPAILMVAGVGLCGGVAILTLIHLMVCVGNRKTAVGILRHSVFGALSLGGVLLMVFGALMWIAGLS